MESSKYSWKYVTSDELLSEGPCELVSAHLVPSAATTDSALYSGRNTSGTKIVDLKASTVDTLPFKPPVPVYCPQGLYVDIGTSVSGVLVQWRNL